MSRESGKYTVGKFTLEKRRDGKAPDVWQIAWYDAEARSIRYRSTRERDLERAKSIIHAHDQAERAKGPQRADEATVIPLLFRFWSEHGKNAIKPGQIANSLRLFIGFLMQDIATSDATVADLNPALFERFRRWRMAPHSYDVPWVEGKSYRFDSSGVNGESVQRNLDDIRACLNHHANNGRIPYSPRVPSVDRRYRSPPKDLVLTRAEMAAIIGYAVTDKAMFRFLTLILATGIRTEAALKMNPAVQYDAERGLIDLHPVGDPRTKKHNPVVPVIPQFAPILKAWAEEPATEPVRSRKTAWRTLRRALSLPPAAEPKTIRHTIATRMRGMGVSQDEISSFLGHSVGKRTTAVYAKYDPTYLAAVRQALSIIFRETMEDAAKWGAVHLRTTGPKGVTMVIDRRAEEAQKTRD